MRIDGQVMKRNFCQRGGAVDRGGLVVLARDREPAGDQDQRPERQRLPDVHQHREAERQRRVVEPVRPVERR